MASVLVGFQSGGFNLLSGSYSSGHPSPVGGAQLRLDKNASGAVYVALSGGLTIQSGLFPTSGAGSGYLDGMPMYAGDAYFIPKIGIGASGFPQIYVNADANCSGQARLYWELF